MTGKTSPVRRKRRPQRSNSLKDLGQLMSIAGSPQAIAPERRRRKTVLTPPLIDPPLVYGEKGIWPDHIFNVRPLPRKSLHDDDRPDHGIWLDGRPFCSVADLCAWFNEQALKAGFPVALVCAHDTFDIWQLEPDAVERCERTDRGPCGQYLRLLRKFPWATPEERAESTEGSILLNNAAIAEVNERVERLTPAPRLKPVAQIICEGERWIYGDASRPVPVYLHRFGQGADT